MTDASTPDDRQSDAPRRGSRTPAERSVLPFGRSPYEPEAHGRSVPVGVRAAVPSDAPLMASIGAEGTTRPTTVLLPGVRESLTRIAQGISTEYACVALVGETGVGFGRCSFIPWSEKSANSPLPDGWYLTGVGVLSGHRRRGIGTALTIHRIDWLRSRTDVVYYFTGEANLPSLDLHRSLGFVEVARDVEVPLPPPFSNDELHVLGKKLLR